MGEPDGALEGVGLNRDFWRSKRVLVTGNTGFKGTWLSLWLAKAGAAVFGYSLPPDSEKGLFAATDATTRIETVYEDIRDLDAVSATVARVRPDVIFHLAAQSLVLPSYERPVETYETNVLGTVNLLEAVRRFPTARSVVVVTTDKCYENREWLWGYREVDPLGGRDPYSSSKACAEIVSRAYRESFFQGAGSANVASARAGNVIGGGDWAVDRLVPDLVRAYAAGETAVVRWPRAVRPWQHVLEPLAGYLLLAERLFTSAEYADAWNFGPLDSDARPVEWVAEEMARAWGDGARWTAANSERAHEAATLKLDSSQARARLGWATRLDLRAALQWTVDFYRAAIAEPHATTAVLEAQIARYEELSGW